MSFEEVEAELLKLRKVLKGNLEYMEKMERKYRSIVAEKNELTGSARKARQFIEDPSVPEMLKELMRKEITSKFEENVKMESDYLAVLYALKELVTR